MLDKSIIRETIRDMVREAFIETINTFNPLISQKSERNLVQPGVRDIVNEQTAQVVAADESE